jgi:hypothetical protein
VGGAGSALQTLTELDQISWICDGLRDTPEDVSINIQIRDYLTPSDTALIVRPSWSEPLTSIRILAAMALEQHARATGNEVCEPERRLPEGYRVARARTNRQHEWQKYEVPVTPAEKELTNNGND